MWRGFVIAIIKEYTRGKRRETGTRFGARDKLLCFIQNPTYAFLGEIPL